MRYFFELTVYSERLKTTFLIISMPFLILLAFEDSTAKIINAKSGSANDLRSAISSTSIGDTVLIPPGDFQFNSQVKIPAGITLMGSGQDVTILRTEGNSSYMFEVSCGNGEPARITGMTIVGSSSGNSSGIKLGNEAQPCIDFRVDNIILKNFSGIGLNIRGNARGVIDHNEFHNIGTYGVFVAADGDASWARPLDLGTADAVFAEDNYFGISRWHHIASTYGSRYVFRYNIIEDNLSGNKIGAHAIDAHGAYDPNRSWPRGSRSYEIYNNTLIVNRFRAIHIRGGDGVIFNNTLEGIADRSIALKNEEAVGGEGDCGNYPCKDQIRELYIWNNTTNGKKTDIYNQHPNIIKEGRDYFLHEKPGYKPYLYPHPLVNNGNLPLRINTQTLPDMIVGQFYSTRLSAVGGKKPYQWKIEQGTLPTGIELKDGSLSGNSNANEGQYNFTIKVIDQKGDSDTQQFSLSISSGIFSSIPYFGNVANWESNNNQYFAVKEIDGDKRYIITNAQSSSSGNKLRVYSLVKDKIYEDFTMSLKVKSPENLLENPGADFAIVFGYKDDDNYYYMMFNSNSSWNLLHKINAGQRSDISMASSALITDNNYHHIELSRKGHQITVKRDNVIVLNISDSNVGKGRIGIGSLNDIAYFDDIEISNTGTIDENAPNAPKNLRISQ